MTLHGAAWKAVKRQCGIFVTACDMFRHVVTGLNRLSLRQFGNSTRCFARSASLQSLASQLDWRGIWLSFPGDLRVLFLPQNKHMLHIPPAKCKLFVRLKHLCQGPRSLLSICISPSVLSTSAVNASASASKK